MTVREALATLGLTERDLRWAASAARKHHAQLKREWWDDPFWRNRRERFERAAKRLSE